MQGNTIRASLDDNMAAMKKRFHADKNKDIVFRCFETARGKRCFLMYIDGMANSQAINDFIIRPLTLSDEKDVDPGNVIQLSSRGVSLTLEEVVTAVLSGDTAVFVDGMSCCYTCETKGFERRSISTPSTENTIKGPQEAFCESFRTNATQIHRILKTPQLITEFISVGGINQNLCAVMYLDDIVCKDTLEEVKRRLSMIKGDFIMGTGMVEQLIEDNPLSIFPSILSTERPDRAAHYLASGRIVILIDGSPFAMVAPISLALLLDSPEGASLRWISGTFSRILRSVALVCSCALSGVYLSLVLYHREMLPTSLAGAIMNASANVPFPLLLEVLIMDLFFELVREAGLRIPHMLGGAISIVGGLILGQSAVQANLVSPVTLIVVALSGLCNAALPDYDLANGIRIMKIFVILMGASFGFLGIAIAIMLIITLLANQSSFGVPMLSMQGLKWSAGTPVIYQLPLWKQHSRPRELNPRRSGSAPFISRGWDTGGEDE